MAHLKIVFVLCGLTLYISGALASQDEHAGIPPLLTDKDDNVGINFLSSKASAGPRGILESDASQKLLASAEMPFEQNVQALGDPVIPMAKDKPTDYRQDMQHLEKPINYGKEKLRSRRQTAPNNPDVLWRALDIPIVILQAIQKLPVTVHPPVQG